MDLQIKPSRFFISLAITCFLKKKTLLMHLASSLDIMPPEQAEHEVCCGSQIIQAWVNKNVRVELFFLRKLKEFCLPFSLTLSYPFGEGEAPGGWVV